MVESVTLAVVVVMPEVTVVVTVVAAWAPASSAWGAGRAETKVVVRRARGMRIEVGRCIVACVG